MSKHWIAPVAAAAAIAGVVTVPAALAASPHPALAPMSAQQLLAAAERSTVRAVDGTIETTASLGLPALPDRIVNGGSGLAALLTGTHRLRVWADGPDRQRLALMGDLTETDVVHDGADVWLYASATNSVTHWTAPRAAHSAGSAEFTPEQQLTPEAQAQRALRAVDPSTAVTVDRTARVAGRPAYQLVLTPRTDATLIGSVRIAFDAATFAPLRVQIFPVGSDTPAWETAFTKVSFTAPAASTFAFRPPAGATVTTHAAPAPGGRGAVAPERGPAHPHVAARTVGSGWASILELPAGTVGPTSTASPGVEPKRGAGIGPLLDRATTSVPEGRLITTRLFCALVTPDGRVFVGAVPAASLERAAQSSRG